MRQALSRPQRRDPRAGADAYYHYGCTTMLGYRYGYEGLNPAFGHHPLPLTPAYVDRIGDFGGTVLGSSRGEQPVEVMVDTLVRDRISVLFTIGGDGTLRRPGHPQEITRRGLDIAVVGIPKTIDNDISCIQQSFGFQTAAEEAYKAVASANTEATGVNNGIGLVKLMGRESGFIAAYTAMVDSMVNFCLIPEVPFALPVFLRVLESASVAATMRSSRWPRAQGRASSPARWVWTSRAMSSPGILHRSAAARRHQAAFTPWAWR
ncbi:MAG: 6-phosphofructokinase [Caldilineaceae bacterium]